ncbi:MAG TPA: hypothetical protein DCL86_15475 [Bacteroidales bacterium]|jgi:hypothetical protein|nr:hypothetical protein [Bacteroidales bacterium]
MITQGFLIKQLSIVLLSAVKFLFAAPISYLFGFSYFHTLLNTSAGGLLGVLFFFFVSRVLIRVYLNNFPLYFRAFEQITGIHFPAKRTVNISSKKKRMLIKLRNRFGYPGIIILTPVLLSIPVGTFIAAKYYSGRPNLLVMLSLSVVGWSVVLTSITAFI